MQQTRKASRHHWLWVALCTIGLGLVIGLVIGLVVTVGNRKNVKRSLERVQLTFSGYSGVGEVKASTKSVAAVRQRLVEALLKQHKETPQEERKAKQSAWSEEIYLYSKLESTFDSEELNEKNILMQYPVEIRPATGLKNGDKVTVSLANSKADAKKYHLTRKAITRTVRGLKEPATISAKALRKRLKVSFTGFNGEGVMIVASKQYGGIDGKGMRLTLPQNGHLKNGQTIKLQLADDYRESQLEKGHAFSDAVTYQVKGLQPKQRVANTKAIQSAMDLYADNDVNLNGATWVKKQQLSVYLMPFAFKDEADLFPPNSLVEAAETVYVAKPNEALSTPSSALMLLGLYRITNADGTTGLRAFGRIEMEVTADGKVEARPNPKGNFQELIYDFTPYSQAQVEAALAKYGQKLE